MAHDAAVCACSVFISIANIDKQASTPIAKLRLFLPIERLKIMRLDLLKVVVPGSLLNIWIDKDVARKRS